MRKLITVIDLGSNKIAACAAAIDKAGGVLPLALENLYSRGIVKGSITDFNKVTEDISSVVDKLSARCGKKIKNVFVTTRGAEINLELSRGMIALAKVPKEITAREVKRCLGIASLLRLPLERAVLESVVKGFKIDGSGPSIVNPIGFYGVKLEVETFNVTINRSKIQNITKCIDHAGLLLGGIHLSSLAAAGSILDEKEKESGVLLLDIGDSLIEALVFKDNTLKSFNLIEKGVRDVKDKDSRVNKEMMESLLKGIVNSLLAEHETARSLVVTGGGALIDGMIENTEKIFALPARMGIVKNAGGNLNSQDAIVHTSTIGLASRIAGEYASRRAHTNLFREFTNKFLEIYESYF